MRELRNIQIFVEVANCGSFSKAAAKLALTPSAVSISIQKLESALGTRLLTRTTRQLQLTSDGQAFFERARDGLDKLAEAVESVSDHDGPPRGALRVSVLTAIGRALIMPALPEFMARYPDIALTIDFNDEMPDLVKEKIDLGLCYGEPLDCSYVGRYLCTPSMVLVASPAYLAASGTPIRPNDLAAHGIIQSSPKDGRQVPWKLRKRMMLAPSSNRPILFQPISKLNIVDCYDSVLEAALSGLGIALAVRKSASRYLQSGQLQALLPSFEVSLHGREKVFLLYPSGKHLPSRVRAFIDFLVEISHRDAWSDGPASELQPRELLEAC
jgi:DNA-binding transcriptional LysR family regulator